MRYLKLDYVGWGSDDISSIDWAVQQRCQRYMLSVVYKFVIQRIAIFTKSKMNMFYTMEALMKIARSSTFDEASR